MHAMCAQNAYTLLLNESYLVTRIEYFHSITCIIKSQISCEQTVKISQSYNGGMEIIAEE